MARRFTTATLLLSILLTTAASAHADGGQADSQGLSEGTFARMHTQIQKTFMKIKVATVDIQFDPQTRDQFAAIAKGRSYSNPLADQIARVAVGSNAAAVRMRFDRNVAYGRWLDNAREALDLSLKAQFIDKVAYAQAKTMLPRVFSQFERRGFQEGDQLVWRVEPAALKLTVLSKDNAVIMENTVEGRGSSKALLAGYLAPGTDCREPLIRSLLSP